MKGSLQKLRDRQLEEPYRSWINGKVSLPTDVIVLPRRMDLQPVVMLLIAVALGCPAIAYFFLPRPLATLRSDPSTDSFLTIVLIGGLVVFLPLLSLRRLYVTMRVRRELRRGVLRQGIIVGPAGGLVRLSPNKCYAIPLERFLRAKALTGIEAGEPDYICIETNVGNIDFSDRSLAADADAVNQAVLKVRTL